jgi:hypothetical protein
MSGRIHHGQRVAVIAQSEIEELVKMGRDGNEDIFVECELLLNVGKQRVDLVWVWVVYGSSGGHCEGVMGSPLCLYEAESDVMACTLYIVHLTSKAKQVSLGDKSVDRQPLFGALAIFNSPGYRSRSQSAPIIDHVFPCFPHLPHLSISFPQVFANPASKREEDTCCAQTYQVRAVEYL